MPTHVVMEPGNLTGVMAAVPVIFATSSGALAIGWLARSWWRAREATRAAERAEGGEKTLRPGAATIVGTVETEDDEAAVVLRVVESGSEAQTKNGWAHTWTETERVIEARSFTLRSASGDAVVVDPGSDPRVIDDLALVDRPSLKSRTREARVEPGERVRASGILEGGSKGEGAYRGGPGGFRLRPPPGGRMLISTVPLAHAHGPWERFYFGWVLFSLVLFAFAQFALGHEYYPLSLHGERGELVVRGLSSHDVQVRGGTRRRYDVQLGREGTELRYETDLEHAQWRGLQVGDSVVIVETPDHARFQLGDGPSVSVLAAGVVLIVAIFAVVLFALTRAYRRRWWERIPIVTEGVGRLEGSTGGDERA